MMPQAGVKITLPTMHLTFIWLTPERTLNLFQRPLFRTKHIFFEKRFCACLEHNILSGVNVINKRKPVFRKKLWRFHEAKFWSNFLNSKAFYEKKFITLTQLHVFLHSIFQASIVEFCILRKYGANSHN